MMKFTLAAFCVLCVAASSAYEIRRDNSALETPIDAESKAVGAEAILVGQVLRYVAHGLEQDDILDNELDEYFFKKLFGKIKSAVGAAVKTVGAVVNVAGHVVKGVGKVAVSPIKAAVGVIKDHATFSMDDNVTEKATKILTKIVDKSVASYSFQDSQNAEAFVKQVCSRIDAVGRRLIEQGQGLLGLYDMDI